MYTYKAPNGVTVHSVHPKPVDTLRDRSRFLFSLTSRYAIYKKIAKGEFPTKKKVLS